LDTRLFELLKAKNIELCQTRISSIETAPEELLKPVYDAISAKVDVPDARIKGDLLRAAAAHMVIRNRGEGNIKEQYCKGHYSKEDIIFLLKRIDDFIEPKVSPLVADEQIKIGKPLRKRDEAKEIIIELLKNAKQTNTISEQLSTLHGEVARKIPGFHYLSAVNSVNELVREGIIERVPHAHGFYRLVEKEDK
jgi:hypothetical protein